MRNDELLHIFVVESRELLDAMEPALLSLEDAGESDAECDASQSEAINAVFRAAHTIKGSAGLFALEPIVAFTHVVESVLDNVRDGRTAVSTNLVGLLLQCGDHIRGQIDAAEAGSLASDDALRANAAPLVEQLSQYLAQPALTRITTQGDEVTAEENSASQWHINLRCGRDMLRNGMDPLSFIRYLATLGDIIKLETLTSALPSLAEMNPESCYLAFDIHLQSHAGKARIEEVFEFVRDDCELSVTPLDASRTGSEIIAAPSASEAQLPVAESTMAKDSFAGAEPNAKRSEHRSVRVDADKLDHLINLVGELIIVAASTGLAARRAHAAELLDCASALGDLVEQVRDGALQLRMVKIGATFNRFQRVVRDVSRDIGKDIELIVRGEDTELDKTVVEKIADPLTHLVRNAIDHGIETADVRRAAGKPAKGRVSLLAYHDSGNIVIEISDDGAGLKRDRILAKAIERGLVEAGRQLSDDEIYALIFEPGFSTAEAITNLSGRGVGMDVVKRNITALRGSVSVQSREGVGTTVAVRLPLTLAIIDGFLVKIGDSTFVLPLDAVEECIAYSAEPGQAYTNLRGHVLPFMRLHQQFGLEGQDASRQNIVVIRHAQQTLGLVVDELLGEFQTVIKPLGKLFRNVSCISGSTILGSGEVALILDIGALFRQAGATTSNTPDTLRS